MPQVNPSHVAAVAPSGTGQGVQLAPHDMTLESARQKSPHLWLRAGHLPEQRLCGGRHAPSQAIWSPEQVIRHCPSWQNAVASAGAGQGVQDMPQEAGLSLDTQC